MMLKIIMINRSDIRTLFGITFANQWGHFTDHWMSQMIHSYFDWPIYPKGDAELMQHSGSVFGATMSDDGYYLFTSSADETIIAWDLLSQKPIQQWHAHNHEIWTLSYSSGLLASGSWDRLIKIWNTQPFQLNHTLKADDGGVLCVDFNPKGDILVSSACNNTVRMWGVNNGECLRVLEGHTDQIYAVRWIDAMILSCSLDESLRVWDPSGEKDCRVITEHIPEIDDFWVNCDSSLIACMGDDGVSVFQWPNMDLQCTVETSIYCGQFLPNDPDAFAFAFVESNSGSICIYNVRMKTVIRNLKNVHFQNIRHLCFSPDGSLLVCMCDDNLIRLCDLS